MQKTTIFDQKLGSIITDGIEGDLVLIGFPYEIGAKRENLPSGHENGPDCLRRFLLKCGPLKNMEYDIDISNINFKDYGNIFIESDKNKVVLEKCLEKLTLKYKSVNKRGGVSIIIGGSREISYSAISGLLSKGVKSIGHIKIGNSLDFKVLFDCDKITCYNTTRKIFNDFGKNIEGFRMMFFGVDERGFCEKDNVFLKDFKDFIEVMGLRKIRKCSYMINNEEDIITEPITQGGRCFKETLKDFQKNREEIQLSISLEAINVKNCFFMCFFHIFIKKAAYCPGVCNPCVFGGLNSEEIIEIMMIAGRCEKIIGLDISDYNPKFEDFRTGLLLGNMIYFFSMGYSLRKKSKENL